MINNRILMVALSGFIFLQTGCMGNKVSHDSGPIIISSLKAEPVTCEDDPLSFYNAMPVLDEIQTNAQDGHTIAGSQLSEDCLKLRRAIRLSMPGSKKQNDEKALSLLKELMQNSALVGRDLKFSMLLMQHVSQRQQLRKKIETQEKRLINTDQKNSALKSQLETLQSQLDQLKNIEIEISKKERSVISPIGE